MPRKSLKTASEAKTDSSQGVDAPEAEKAAKTEETRKKPGPPKGSGGRPPVYSKDLANQICEMLSEGVPLQEICRMEGFPAWRTVYYWMYKDPELSAMIAHARDVGQDAMAEKAYIEMYQEPERILSEGGGKIDPGYVQLIKARAEITLNMLAKWNPKRYGDRMQVAGDAENPLAVKADVTIFDAIIENLEAKRQAKAHG
jgi:hypothetical protein